MGLEHRVVFGRYKVLWRLEHRNLVKTYLARDEQSEAPGTPVVIKQYLHDLGDAKRDSSRAFFEELRALKSLNHPGVVSMLDFGNVENSLVIALEYVRGATLNAVCQHFERQEQSLPPRLAVFIARRILEDLSECRLGPHQDSPVVHGRITVSAVHIQRSGQPKLTDFGLATLEDVATEAESQLGFFRTRMSYAAPEITRGDAPSTVGDMYSVALLLYRLLTGSNPFRGQSIPETVNLVMQHQPQRVSVADWAPSERASAVLLRALDKNPERRYPSTQAFIQALRELQIESDVSVAAELAKIVEVNVAADWEQIARLSRSLSRHPRPAHALQYLVESNSPAFVSGLLTQRPHFPSEHSARDLEQVQSSRRTRWGAIPTIVLPAAAITLGLFLGKLNWQGGSGSALGTAPAVHSTLEEPVVVAAPAAAPALAAQAQPGSLSALRSELRACLITEEPATRRATVELAYDTHGQLEAVRLLPHELAQSRTGACLLRTAWEQSVQGAGQISVVIPISVE